LGPFVFVQQLADGKRSSRLVAMDTRRDIDARFAAGRLVCAFACYESGSNESGQADLLINGNLVLFPAVRFRGREAISQDGVEIDRFPKIAVGVFSEALLV
jgi:hypothetical protein